MQHHHRDIGRRDPADPLGLVETGRTEASQFLFGFSSQMGQPVVVEVIGNSFFRQPFMFIDRRLLATNVA